MNDVFTIFGGTGDLTLRKLLPAFYNMSVLNQLDKNFKIIAVGRRNYDKKQYLEISKPWIKRFARVNFDEEAYASFTQHIEYFRMDMNQLSEYERLNHYYQSYNVREHIFYYAVAPKYFFNITRGLNKISQASAKVIIEKPFGENIQSARQLNLQLEEQFGEENVYHIDHYLGKEMIQNIQTIRFQNAIFANVFDAHSIANVQISALEEVGIGSRGAYYDESGALKDMVQNHLLQILSIVAMEKPQSFESKDIHQEQLKVLQALRPVSTKQLNQHLVLGQYQGYRKEENVNEDTLTETFAALKLYVDNERWANVPFYIRTGKKLHHREIEVVIEFKKVSTDAPSNLLIIKIQPTEGVYLQFNIKKPGRSNVIETVKMDFCQNCIDLNRMNTPEAYERLLKAALDSDGSLFSEWDQIETSWNFMNQLIENAQGIPLYSYQPFSYGPVQAEQMLAEDGFYWHQKG